jgi:Ca2+-binding EF-hand superfamily protein
MKRFLSIVLASLLLFSCASHPRNRTAPPVVFHPDAVKVREAFGLSADQIPDGQRMNQIGRNIWALCRNIHPVRSSLDLVFDNNHDGRIDKDELRVARGYFYGASLLSLNDIDPALAQQIAVPPRTTLSQEDLRVWYEYLFDKPQIFLVPHALANNFERKLSGGAQAFDAKVIQSALDLVSRGAAEAFLKSRPLASGPAAPIPPSVARGPVKNQLQAYANTSGTGVVSEQEGRIADDALKAPHSVTTAFDHAIDFTGSGFIDASDIAAARRAAFLSVASAQSYVKGPFPVVTKADALLDIDGDGVVTEAELQTGAQALASAGASVQIPPKLLAAFDVNGDGKLDANEIARALEFFRPHPVNQMNALDVALDEKKTGFLSADEIGIGAGHTAKGRTQSLDERIQALRLAPGNAPQQMAVFSQKHIDITGKKLAVVGLTSTTKNIGQEDLDGTTTFLENAFVNVGSVSIVDRSDIDKVMSELELQLSGAVATNDANAVKVGKLSGADIIVTGTISLVGKKYYLNVRLIKVDTGDILGSSVASADSPDGFLDMCQQAAAKILQ